MTTENTEQNTDQKPPLVAPPQIGGDNSHLTGIPHQAPAADQPVLSERAQGIQFKWSEPFSSKGQLPGSGNLAIAASSSVLATAYRPNDPRPVDVVTPETMVKVEASSGRMVEMSAEQAAAMGRLVRTSDGFRDVTDDDVAIVDQAHAERAADTPVTIADVKIDIDADQNFFGHLEQSLRATGHSLQPLIAAILAEEPSSTALYQAASHAGVDPEEAAADLGKILDGYATKAFGALIDFNILPADDLDAFGDWLDTPANKSGKLSAMMEAIYGGGLTTLTSLAGAFKVEHSRDMAKQNADQER
jgi:hypothetical protein